MRWPGWIGVGLIAIALVALVVWLRRPIAVSAGVAQSSSRTVGSTPPAPRSRMANLVATIPAAAISPIARDLNGDGGTIRHDLELLNEVFGAWQSNFPHAGNPVGENDEITAALAGDNPLHFAFIAPTHPAIDPEGRLRDRWGTPFRFHQLSGTVMELRSAGPDRKFGTDDDVVLTPGQ